MKIELLLSSGRLLLFSVPVGLVCNRVVGFIPYQILRHTAHVEIRLTAGQRRKIRALLDTLKREHPRLAIADIELHDGTQIKLFPR